MKTINLIDHPQIISGFGLSPAKAPRRKVSGTRNIHCTVPGSKPGGSEFADRKSTLISVIPAEAGIQAVL